MDSSDALGLEKTHTEGTPDVCRAVDATQRLHFWIQVLSIFGVGDDHCGPVLKRQVRKTQEVMVKGQDPVSVERKSNLD